MAGEEQNDESTDEEIEAEGGDDIAEEKRQRKRMRAVKDWRETQNAFQAFWTGSLRHNDYQIINSLIIGHAALALCGYLVCEESDSYLGITIIVPLVHYGMAIFSLIKHLSTDAKMEWYNYFFFFLAYAIQYGWGAANLFLSYTYNDIDPSIPGAANAGLYIILYLMVIPFITSCATAIFKWIDDKGKISPFFVIQIVLTMLQGVGMLVLAYVYMTYVQGIIISVVVLAVGYIVL